MKAHWDGHRGFFFYASRFVYVLVTLMKNIMEYKVRTMHGVTCVRAHERSDMEGKKFTRHTTCHTATSNVQEHQ